MKRPKAPPRFYVKDIRKGQDTGLRTIREPWKVIDSTTNSIVDEYASGRAARMAASFMNKQAKAADKA